MTLSLNKVTIIGNLGRDPEIRTTSDGKEIASLGVATSERWKDRASGEQKEKTEWHKVTIFNEGLVRVVKDYAKKGTKLYIEGSLQTNKWIDKTSGQEKYSTEIVLQNYNSTLILLDGRNSNGDSYNNNLTNSSVNNQTQKSDFSNSFDDDEIPF